MNEFFRTRGTSPPSIGGEEMGVFKSKRGWVAQVNTGERYADGRPKYQQRNCKTKKEAMSKEKELLLQLHEKLDQVVPEEPEKSNELFKVVAKRWIEKKRTEPSKKTKKIITQNTWERYRIAVESVLIPKFGDRIISEIDEDEVRAHINSRISQTDKRHHYIALQGIFELVKLNTMTEIDWPGPGNPEIRCITDPEELASLIEGFKGTVIYIPSVIGSATGARFSEIAGLKWFDIDFKNCTISINRTLHWAVDESTGEKYWYIGDTKNWYSRRTIKVNKKTIRILKNEKERREAKPGDFVCLDINGNPICRHNIGPRFKEKALQKGYDLTFKSLRHSHATILIMVERIDPKTVSRRLGHASTDITLRIYSQYMPGNDELCANAMEEIFTSNDNDEDDEED